MLRKNKECEVDYVASVLKSDEVTKRLLGSASSYNLKINQIEQVWRQL